jgi:hypothetical protein
VRRSTLSLARNSVHPNGIKRLPDDIRYRVHISLLRDEGDNKAMRGADNSRALRNYRGDRRVIAVCTVNRRNIGHLGAVTQLCADHDIPITFMYFSPTDDYLARLSGKTGQESEYFRGSAEGDDLWLQPGRLGPGSRSDWRGHA